MYVRMSKNEKMQLELVSCRRLTARRRHLVPFEHRIDLSVYCSKLSP